MGVKRGRSDDSQVADVMTDIQQQLRLNLKLWGATNEAEEKLLALYSAEGRHLEDLMTRTLTLGESNSALVLAPRGTGKSTLVNVVLGKLGKKGVLGDGFVVRLSGLVQTDDRLALKEITAQLRLESAAANKVFGSFAENLAFLLESLRSGSKEKSKPVIFLLDEFDLFCHHRNQTLLYNLFDVAQSAQAPICVLGLTCRLDVIELLEKRVKSRFSHRQIHLFPPDAFDPHYINTFKDLLTLPNSFTHKESARKWNTHVAELAEDMEVRRVLKRLHTTTKDVRALKTMLFPGTNLIYYLLNTTAKEFRAFKTLLLLCVCELGEGQEKVTAEMLTHVHAHVSADAKRNIIQGLSVLQLSLMIAMSHLTSIYEGEPFNFEMVLHEYLKFTRRHAHSRPLPRPVVFKAFDQLKTLELIRGVDSSRGVQREYCLYHLMISPTHLTLALSSIPDLPTDLQHWASSPLAS